MDRKTVMTSQREMLLKRLLYQSWHRGCKETDMLLGQFAKKHLHEFSDEELVLYEQFLEENDWNIYAWLTQQLPFPEPYLGSTMLEKLTTFKVYES